MHHVTDCGRLLFLFLSSFVLLSAVPDVHARRPRARPSQCCLPNPVILKDKSVITTSNATDVTDSYEMTTYTVFKDRTNVEIQVFEPERAQMWIVDTSKPGSRRTMYLSQLDGVWCKEPESIESAVNVSAFDLFLTGCNGGDRDKFVGWDKKDNEVYAIESLSESYSERSTMYLERLSANQCEPTKVIYEREVRLDGVVETMLAESKFVDAKAWDLVLVEMLVSADECGSRK